MTNTQATNATKARFTKEGFQQADFVSFKREGNTLIVTQKIDLTDFVSGNMERYATNFNAEKVDRYGRQQPATTWQVCKYEFATVDEVNLPGLKVAVGATVNMQAYDKHWHNARTFVNAEKVEDLLAEMSDDEVMAFLAARKKARKG